MAEPDGAVAGRLSVIVEASLKGFKKKLEQKVEAASKGVAATVGVEIDSKGLKQALQAKVDEAAAGVTATIAVDVDVKQVKAKVEAAAKAAASQVKVKVETDTSTVVEETVGAAEAAEKATGRGILVRMRAGTAGFFGEVAGAIAKAKAMGRASGGVDVPVNAGGASMGGGSKGGLPLRMLFRGGVIFSLLSLIQPAVGAIGQLIGGLTAMVGAAAPAVGVLSAMPISLAAIVQGAMAGKVAFQGMGDAMGLLAQEQSALARGEKLSTAEQEKLNEALKELSPSAIEGARALVGLRDDWVKVRKVVQENFWRHISDEIDNLANVMLPTLQRGLAVTSDTLGKATEAGMKFLQGQETQRDIGNIMENNNVIFGDFLYMIGQFSKGSIDFLMSSRKFGRGVGKTMAAVGDWFSGKMAKGRRTGSTADFLEKASEKASQLWNILKQIGGGFAGIFRAATPSGERLLTMFEGFVTNWHEWVDSTKGQKFLKDWFKGTEDGFVELARLINDTFKGMAKWANDPKIVGMIEMLRTELGPALGDFLKNLSDDAGEGVISILTEITRLAGHLEPAVEVIGQLTRLLARLLGVINDFGDANPDTMRAVAHIIGGLVVVGTIARIGKLAGALLGLSGAAKKAGKAAGPLSRLAKAMPLLGAIGKSPLLKKAGIIGAVLTAIDIASSLEKAYHAGRDLRERFNEGFADGPGTTKSKGAVKTQWDEMFGTDGNAFTNPFPENLGRWMDDFNIDVERLQTDMAKFGTQGDYYQEVVKKLTGESSGALNQVQDKVGIIPWVNNDAEVARLIKGDLEDMGKQAQKEIDAYNKRVKLNWTMESIIELGKAKVQSSSVVAARAQLRQQLMDQLGIKPNADGTGGLFELLIDPMIRTKGPKGPKGPKAPRVKPPKGSDPENPFFELYNGPAKPVKAPNVKPIKRSAEEIRSAVKRVQNAWGDVAVKAKQSAKTQGAAAGRTKDRVREFGHAAAHAGEQSKKAAQKAGGSWVGAAKKTAKGTRISAQGAKTLEAASKKAATAARNAGKIAGTAYNGMAKKAKTASNQATKAIDGMTKAIKQKVSTLRGIVTRGMDAVVKAVRSKIGPTKAAATRISTGIVQAFKGLPGKLTTVGGQAMDGLAAGIRARGSAAVAAARDIASQVAAASRTTLEVKSPSRVMKRIGEWVMQGLSDGITDRGRVAIKSSAKITRALANSMQMEMSMPGKKAFALSGSDMKKFGDLIRAGKTAFALSSSDLKKGPEAAGVKITHAFLRGIEKGKKAQKALRSKLRDFLTGGFKDAIGGGSVKAVRKAFAKFYAIIDKKTPNTKAGRARMKALKREFRDEMRLLVENAKAREAKQKAIDKAQEWLEERKAKRAEMKESYKSTTDESGSITNIAAANGGYITPARLIASLKKKVSRALEFKKLLADLRSKGLGEEAYLQLMELGFDAGLPIARQLAKGDSAALQEITRLQNELDVISGDTGDETAAHFFDAGIEAGKALVQALQKDLDKLEEVGTSMAKAFISEIQSVLGLNLGVKPGGDLEAPATPAGGGGGGGGGAANEGRHKWVPIGPKNRKCKTCKKPKSDPIHSNSGVTAFAASAVQVKGAPGGFAGIAQAVAASSGPSRPNGHRGELVNAGVNARSGGAEAAAGAGGGGGDTFQINLSGIPDRQAAKDVLDETRFAMRRIQAGGRRGRGSRR